MTITFDGELELKRSKSESFSKLCNEAPRPYPKGIPEFIFSKIPSFTLLFHFFVFFFTFFEFSLLFHLFILVNKF